VTEEAVLGALNIYSRSVDAFADHEQQWADTFAAGAAAVVTRAHEGVITQELETQLQEALESREVIALAQGITMSRVGGTAAQAHSVLREVSARSDQSLLEVCRSVVAGKGRAGIRTPGPGGEHEPDTG
jgi:hypothetical protein